MDERASRVFVGLSVLVLLWIAVYWLWVPNSPRVSYGGDAPPVRTTYPESAPVQQETVPAAGDPVWMGEQPEPATVIPPGFRRYTIRANDTFESIAREQWGDASLWTVVARANPLKDPGRLKAGQVIRLPNEIGNIQGVAHAPQGDPDPANSERTYVVRSGDTLSSIAQIHLGSSADAARVYELNRDRLTDIHSLRVGQELRLPPAESGG